MESNGIISRVVRVDNHFLYMRNGEYKKWVLIDGPLFTLLEGEYRIHPLLELRMAVVPRMKLMMTEDTVSSAYPNFKYVRWEPQMWWTGTLLSRHAYKMREELSLQNPYLAAHVMEWYNIDDALAMQHLLRRIQHVMDRAMRRGWVCNGGELPPVGSDGKTIIEPEGT